MSPQITTSVKWFPLLGLLIGATAYASDGITSEASHFAGNAVIASAATIVVHKYCPKVKRPALTGFIVSASEIALGEAAEAATGGKFSALDVLAGTLGAAAGSYATHQWYIAPKIESRKGDTTYAVMVSRKF